MTVDGMGAFLNGVDDAGRVVCSVTANRSGQRHAMAFTVPQLREAMKQHGVDDSLQAAQMVVGFLCYPQEMEAYVNHLGITGVARLSDEMVEMLIMHFGTQKGQA